MFFINQRIVRLISQFRHLILWIPSNAVQRKKKPDICRKSNNFTLVTDQSLYSLSHIHTHIHCCTLAAPVVHSLSSTLKKTNSCFLLQLNQNKSLKYNFQTSLRLLCCLKAWKGQEGKP